MLAWFKYAGFLARNLNALGAGLTVPQIVLPIGISFFTFLGLSYVIDVYRADAECQRSPLSVALYVGRRLGQFTIALVASIAITILDLNFKREYHMEKSCRQK